METKEKIKLVRKDRVYLISVCGGEEWKDEIFALDDIKKAEKRAKELNEYRNNQLDGRKYYIKIINEYVDNFGNGYQCKPSEIPWLIKKIEERYE